MKTHRAFARQNAYGYWEGCIEYPCGTVSAVTNAKHTEGAALDIAQRMSEGADARYAKAQSDAEYRRQYRLGRVMPGHATCIANTKGEARGTSVNWSALLGAP
jgi:hypothetical protein